MSPHQYALPTTNVLIIGEEDNGKVIVNTSDYDPKKHVKCDAEGEPLEEATEDPDTDGDGTVSETEAAVAKQKAEAKEAKRKARAEKKAKEFIPIRK